MRLYVLIFSIALAFSPMAKAGQPEESMVSSLKRDWRTGVVLAVGALLLLADTWLDTYPIYQKPKINQQQKEDESDDDGFDPTNLGSVTPRFLL